MTNETRNTIRNHAHTLGAKYRITASGQVDYYGKMPNSPQVGWYFMAWSARDLATDIKAEDEMIAEGLATR